MRVYIISFVCFTFFVCMYACNNSSTDVHIFLSNHPTIFSFICKRILRLNPFFLITKITCFCSIIKMDFLIFILFYTLPYFRTLDTHFRL